MRICRATALLPDREAAAQDALRECLLRVPQPFTQGAAVPVAEVVLYKATRVSAGLNSA